MVPMYSNILHFLEYMTLFYFYVKVLERKKNRRIFKNLNFKNDIFKNWCILLHKKCSKHQNKIMKKHKKRLIVIYFFFQNLQESVSLTNESDI